MHRAATEHHPSSFRTPRPGSRAPGWVRLLWMVLLAVAWLAPGRAGAAEITTFEVQRADDGLQLNYAVNFDLPRGAEEALSKAVPLYFVAEAEVFRDRWYWRDKRVAQTSRVWRIVFQPLTFTYRVTFGGLSQSYASRAEALAAISRNSRWKIAEPGQIEEGSTHYVEFSFRLDTTLLPRPMQIGIGGQPEWTLQVDKVQRFN